MLVRGSLFLAASNGVAVLAPEVLRRAVDAIGRGAETRALLAFGALLVGVAVGQGIFRFFMRNILIGFSRHLEYDLRQHLFGHLTRLSLSFYRRRHTGDIMARATNDLEAVRTMVGPGLMYGLNTLVLVPTVVVLMARRDPLLTLVALLPFPLLTLTVRRLGRLIHQRFKEVQRCYSCITTLAQENLAGIRVVKAMVREEEEARDFGRASREYLGENLRLARIWACFHPVMGLATGLSAIAVLGFGGARVAQGTITLGDLVALLAYVAMLSWPMMALGWVAGLFERGLASLERMGELLDVQPDVEEPTHPAHLPQARGEIVFDRVSFAYNGEPVLREVSFQVPAGTTTAIVGRTGSGKSTLLALVPRLFDVTGGRILLDGTDVRELSVSELRRAIGYVPQETFLFSASLRENILFGAEAASEERFLEAVAVSQLGRDAEQFPEGYDTLVGERGITLSGGERQRTALSRALVRDPAVLLLDDPIASVDTSTEEAILLGLEQVLHRRTCLLVSHRLTAVRAAHQIVVLDRGRVAEIGSYPELVRREGLFADLVRRQQLLRELEGE